MKENKSTKEEQNQPKEYRKRVYNTQEEMEKIFVRISNNRTQVVLVNTEGQEHTFKLVKELEKKSKKGNWSIVEEETEQVKESELNDFMPDVFNKLAEFFRDNPKETITVNLSYSESGLPMGKDLNVYRWFFPSDVETITSEKLFDEKTHMEKIEKLIEKADNYNKGKEVSI